MKKYLISMFILAISSSLCCVGAISFLIFGVSLVNFDFLAPFRVYLGIATCILYCIFIYKKLNQKNKIRLFLIGLALLFIVFYPEIIGAMI
ncbi:hypothetical protein [Campylobacter sp. 2018MI13]|uniref:hypothetical protein n=1 Tax=Campylobacter sp. 2018MI13 TaxID=2836737 RepID=UPI001BD99274|nr:hypothetical protein [Campylobacter sp. 2018MI13]MBT0882589.1 hypothetical protein [Campylobacter sp. 2018MI13]